MKKTVDRLFPFLLPDYDESIIVPESGNDIISFKGSSAYSDDFDIIGLMSSAEDPDTGLIRDLKLDDRDLPLARNYLDYNLRILGKDVHPPWLIQMWAGLMLFGEVCPVCTKSKYFNLEYIVEKMDKKTPGEELGERMVLLENGRCPKCNRHKRILYKKYNLKIFLELVYVLGQRSGKSSDSSNKASYALHRYLKFPMLATMTKAMQKSTELTATFVAQTFGKAVGNLWTPLVNIIDGSTWFHEYHNMLDFYQNKYGTELYRKKDIYIKYYHKSLKLYPTHPQPQLLRGDTRFMGSIDELDLFPLVLSDEEANLGARADADEAHKSLTNSLSTVQQVIIDLIMQGYNPPPAIMMSMSSPVSLRGKIMRLLRESMTEEGSQTMLGINLPTWKVNPHLEKTSPVIAAAYRRNPEKAERDFGANPPSIHSTYISRNILTPDLFSFKCTHTLDYKYDEAEFLYGNAIKVRSVPFPTITTIDGGSTNNSFTLSCGYYDFDTGKTVACCILECMPHDNKRIDFNLMYKHVILPIMKANNSVGLIADQWQSLDLLHRAREDMGKYPDKKPKCLSKQYSPKRKDFDFLVSMMESKNLVLPFLTTAEYKHIYEGNVEDYKTLKGKPAQHLLLQLLTVKETSSKAAPTKGEGFTDDILRSLVLLTKIHEPSVMERLKRAKDTINITQSQAPAPIFVSRSGM